MSKSNKRICFFNETLNAGGIERVTLNLADELVKRSFAVDLFVSKLTGEYISQIPEGVKVFSGNGRVRNILPFVRYLYSQKPEVLITAHIHISIISIIVSKLLRLPSTVVVVVHVHSSQANKTNNYLRAFIMRNMAKFSYPLADRVVAVSEASADDLSHFIDYPRDKIDVIYNPVVTQKLFSAAKEKLNHSWFNTSDVPVILSAGRLAKQKDFHTLIRAFAIVRKSVNAKLVILGEGEERCSLEQLILQLEIEQDVDLAGYKENPYAYMARASVFVLSSIWEGLPTVLIESLALGLPLVATDCPGGSREILNDGKYGVLVPVGNFKLMAEAILKVLKKSPDKEVLINRGMEYSIQKSADRYCKLLNLGD